MNKMENDSIRIRCFPSKAGWGFAAGLLFAVLANLSVLAARAQPGAPVADSKESKKEDGHRAKELRSNPLSETQQYCSNIAAAAAIAQNARQEKRLTEIEQQISRRLAELETKRAQLQDLLDRRDALVHKVNENLVAIYSRMRPDAAAMQLSNMDEETAAVVLLQLQPKIASAILNEIEAPRAVALTKKLSSISAVARAEKKP